MTSTLAMHTSDDVEKLASLERRVADLEARSQSTQTWLEWLRSLLHWLATTPPLLLVLLVGIDHLSTATALPLGLLLIVLWASAAVLWAAVEVLAGGDLRFRVTRLILLVAMLAVILAYWQVTVHQPYAAEQSCLASLKGLSPNVHREPIGPAWLIRLLGEASFGRVYKIELAGPEVDGQQLRHLHALPHLYSLWLTGPRVDDEMIDNLPDLPGLRFICLNQSRATKSGVERLRRAHPLVNVFVQ
jgi:hypothetical protein